MLILHTKGIGFLNRRTVPSGQKLKTRFNKRTVWVVLLVAALLFCAVMALQARRGQMVTLPGSAEFRVGQAENAVLFDHMELAPGVYEFYLTYDTDVDYAGHCTVLSESMSGRFVFTNGEHFYRGKGQTGFAVWVFAPVKDLCLSVAYAGDAGLRTGALTIRNTGKLWTMLATSILCAALLGWLFFWFGRRTGVRTRVVVAGILGIALLASLSQLGDYLLGGADLTYHLQRIEGVKDSIRAGVFPVRIEPEWLYGHGYANGIFYCDLLLYLPAFFRLAGFPITVSYNIYCIFLNVTTAAIAWYCFDRIFRDSGIALLCSALYTLSIIRIYKLAIVGAVGEGSAITFLPLVFYGMYLVFGEKPQEKEKQKAWIFLAVGYAGLIQTHVLTCEITAFLTVLTCLIFVRKILHRQTFLLLLKGALGALGLSMWYLIPFVDYYLTQDMHIRHVSGRTIQERGLYPVQLFVNTWSERTLERFAEKGYPDVETVSPGLLPVIALLIFILLWVFLRKRICGAAKIAALYAILLLGMTLRVFPWNALQDISPLTASLVSSLQFPNRFLGWAMVFLTMLFGTCIISLRDTLCARCKTEQTVAAVRRSVCLGAAVLTLVSILTGSLYLLRDASGEEHRLYLYNEAGMGFGYISGAEYLVQGTDDLRLTFAGPVPGEHVQIDAYDKHYQTIRCRCTNESDGESYIDMPLLLYKGYCAYAGNGGRLSVTNGENHLVRVLLPAGYAGDVTVRFVSPFYWRIAEGVTAFAIIWIVWQIRKNALSTKRLAQYTRRGKDEV